MREVKHVFVLYEMGFAFARFFSYTQCERKVLMASRSWHACIASMFFGNGVQAINFVASHLISHAVPCTAMAVTDIPPYPAAFPSVGPDGREGDRNDDGDRPH